MKNSRGVLGILPGTGCRGFGRLRGGTCSGFVRDPVPAPGFRILHHGVIHPCRKLHSGFTSPSVAALSAQVQPPAAPGAAASSCGAPQGLRPGAQLRQSAWNATRQWLCRSSRFVATRRCRPPRCPWGNARVTNRFGKIPQAWQFTQMVRRS